MQLHIIGGFLGSGKTTAIIGAARYLAAKGKQVGVITNDQGRHLVDTLILRAEALPAMEVSGGCFCCHFDDLNQRLKDLIDQYHPDVIFAESVGSCADLVATVVRPLLEMEIGALKPSSYTVFADVRLLHRYLNNMEMPFNEGINYIFGKQIEEAGLLFINKTDLVDADRIKDVTNKASQSYPGTQVITASALCADDIAVWVDGLLSGAYPAPTHSLDIDYDTYAEAEGSLGWIDREYRLSASSRPILREILKKWVNLIKENQWMDGHVKVVVSSTESAEKISLAQSGEMISESDFHVFLSKDICVSEEVTILLNMLVEGNPTHILQTMHAGLDAVLSGSGAKNQVVQTFERVPGYPQPTHRME